MGTETISIRVDADAARTFKALSPEAQRKLEALLSLRLLEIAGSEESLAEVIHDISRNAQERGLTPEILRTILDEN